jgi:hypothetical protein
MKVRGYAFFSNAAKSRAAIEFAITQPVRCNRLRLGRFWGRSGPDNLKRHKARMRVRPRHRVALRFKESVDHDRIALAGSSSACASGFATDYGRSGVDGGAGAIREDNFTPVRNSLWIDSAMSGVQTLTGAGVFRSLTCRVTGNACKNRFLARKSGRC